MSRASRKDAYTGITRSKEREEREDEVDIEKLKEPEDAPVIVDM